MNKFAICAIAAGLAGSFAAAPACAASDFTYSTYTAKTKPAEAKADPEPHWAPTVTKDWPAKAGAIDTNTRDLGFPQPVGPIAPVRIELGTAFEHDSTGGENHAASAFLPGVKLGVSVALTQNSVVNNQISYFTGKGNLSNAEFGGHSADRSILEIESQYKFTQPGWEQVWLVGGLGYRLTNQDYLGYDDVSSGRNQRLFASIGVERTFAANDSWAVTPRANFKWVVFGRQYVDYHGGESVSQHGIGAELAADFTYRAGGRDLTVTPYLRTWNFNSKTFGDGAIKAANREREAGVALSLKF